MTFRKYIYTLNILYNIEIYGRNEMNIPVIRSDLEENERLRKYHQYQSTEMNDAEIC